ncbi:zinc ribbon domain-containing protein [Butyrivibrio proteoclasticus]|uniref:zinc ribbon domain-containing protein n=1 Tax=Butyrivibrio proteoclasticus TaxID=43305 RepID=UPI00047B50C4|nr:zinc ribbon domain-containing protein [Butyrivibrio proteoclasticus]
MKCEVCGNKIKKGQDFCEVCGTPVNTIENDVELEKKLTEELKNELKSESKSKHVDNLEKEIDLFDKKTWNGVAKSSQRKLTVLPKVLAVVIPLAICLFMMLVVPYFMENAGSSEFTTKLEGVAIYNTNGIIVNSNGEKNEQFKNHGDLRFYPTFDHEQALVIDGKTCYQVNGNLKPYKIGKNIDGAIIAKSSGDVVFSNTDKKTLDYYDAATGEIYHISDDCPRIDYVAISNNGQYVVFYDNRKDVMMLYEKNGHCDAFVADYLYCIAISDDASRAYFEKYEAPSCTIIYLHDGKYQFIDKNPSWDYVISSDCREFLSYGYEDVHYFKEGYEEAHIVLTGEYIDDVYFASELVEKGRGSFDHYFIDQPSLEQCIFETEENVYYFYDGDKKPVNLDISPRRERRYAFFEDRIIALNILDYKLYQTVAIGGELQKTEFTDIDFNVKEVECNEDMSSIFIGSFDDELYQLVDRKPVFITEYVGDYYGMEYDKYEKKFFYANAGNLYSITNGEETIVNEFDDCAKFTYISYEFGDFIAFEGNTGKKYVRVLGNMLKVRKN